MNPEDIRRVGRWPVRRLLGQGGFSWVFEVVDEKLGVARALKMLKPEAARGEQFKRFWREARLLASLSDPHLVTIYELDQDPETGCHYYVMELFTGSNLEKSLAAEREGRFEWPRTVDIFLGILQALSRLHAHRPDPVIHRDIKPSNIQLTEEGRPKLFDLGIARVLRSSDATVGDSVALTSAHSFIGTPKYASPEQLEGAELGTESDVFSLGLCLYQALAGRHLYESISDLDTQSYQSIHRYMVIAEHRRSELPVVFPRELGIPSAVQEVVARAVRLQPEQRFRDAGEMYQALAAAREGRDAAKQAPRPWLPRVAAMLLVVLLAGGAFWIARPQVEQWMKVHFEPSPPKPPTPDVDALQGKAQDAARRAKAGGAVDVAAFGDAMAASGQALRAGQEARAAGNLSEARADFKRAADGYGRAIAIRQAAQERKQAAAMSSVVQKLVDSGTLAPATAKPFRAALDAAETAWSTGAYQDADRSYRQALGTGKEIVASLLQREFADLDAARSKAMKAGAERSATSAFQNADDLSAQAHSAGDDGRTADARNLVKQAMDAYAAAAGAAGKALADARNAMGVADAAAKRVGDCSGLVAGAAAPCSDGKGALAAGRSALGRLDAPLALQKFQDAKEKLDLAWQSSQRPPVLSLDAHGRLHLKVGDHRTIHATAKAPGGGPVSVIFTLTDPRGKRRQHTGTSFPFAAEQSGTYELQAVARDAKGAESLPERLALNVSRAAPAPSRRPKPGPSDGIAQVLQDYTAAIKEKDIHSLAVVYRMDPGVRSFFDNLFNQYARLDVTTYILSKEAHGDTASVRFTQSLRGINPDGSITPIMQGPMRADLLRRPGGWQITSLKRAGN